MHHEHSDTLDYKLGVGLREDDSSIYEDMLHRILQLCGMLALLQNEKSLSAGIALQRAQAAFNSRYLRKVIGL